MSRCEICNENTAIHRCVICRMMTCSEHGRFLRDEMYFDRVWVCDKCLEKVRRR
ncbi:MAG: hypothetical protein H5T46_05720 [Archaeoglobi archaeon]|nr:hypothetical protein [Candidatus Mnemosynella sp.]MBC7114794.1 hypothetical protein [Candidatus Mnemosynella bozhongmuii]